MGLGQVKIFMLNRHFPVVAAIVMVAAQENFQGLLRRQLVIVDKDHALGSFRPFRGDCPIGEKLPVVDIKGGDSGQGAVRMVDRGG